MFHELGTCLDGGGAKGSALALALALPLAATGTALMIGVYRVVAELECRRRHRQGRWR